MSGVEIWRINTGERPSDPDTYTYLTKQHGLPIVPLGAGDVIVFNGEPHQYARTEWHVDAGSSTVRYYVYPPT